MAREALDDLVEFLEVQAGRIRELEKEGEELLNGPEGQEKYEKAMRSKAGLLRSLPRSAGRLVDAVSKAPGEDIRRRLEYFSASASTALSLGSVFYMSALLYPEDHKLGQPNDLEVFIGEVRRLKSE